jgi:transcriptional regulator with XRE-family HTH domain
MVSPAALPLSIPVGHEIGGMAKLILQFGQRLRTLRKAKGLTLEQLGQAAALGYKHIAEVERGVKLPSFEAIEKLAEALTVQPYELFLPETLPAGLSDRNLRLLVAEIDRHGTPELKEFLVEVLAAGRNLARRAAAP